MAGPIDAAVVAAAADLDAAGVASLVSARLEFGGTDRRIRRVEQYASQVTVHLADGRQFAAKWAEVSD